MLDIVRSTPRRLIASAVGIVVGLAVLTPVGLVLRPGDAKALQPSAVTTAIVEVMPPTPLRRLTRFEYTNSLRDLFGIQFPFTEELPTDGLAEGFDNNADTLALTPVLLETYLRVARKASDLVLATGSRSAVTETFPAISLQAGWIEGLPMGTRGGMRVDHYFPHTGVYELGAILDYLLPGGKRTSMSLGLARKEGVRLFRESVSLSAGMHTLFVTFPNSYAASEGPVPNLKSAIGVHGLGGPIDIHGSAIMPTLQLWIDGQKVKTFDIQGPAANEAAFEVQPGPPILGAVEITGPLNVVQANDAPARRHLMSCEPRRRSAEKRCAENILKRIARRAYRREVTPEDMEPILAAFARKRETANFDQAIGMGVTQILVSPDFLFRVEVDPPGARNGQLYRVSDAELATRLSFFLWSSIPDERLLDAARGGELQGAGLETQIRRLLQDARADALVDSFAMQWLEMRALNGIRPDASVYPEFNGDLAEDFRQETRLFLRSVMRENRSILEVISSDYTFLNERLADLYGIEGVKGQAFRKVALAPESQRGGVISQASVLMLSSHPAQTSPILRGKWILTNLMNSPPPIPPPGVPALDTGAAADGRKLTTREQIERHRGSPLCASCHSKMDPYGIALENYDVLGRWRTEENGLPLDTSTALPRGKTFTGPTGLKEILLARSDEFASATVSRLMTYALGRKLEKSDQVTVQNVVQTVKPGGYRFADIVTEIVNSPPFQMRQALVTQQQLVTQQVQP